MNFMKTLILILFSTVLINAQSFQLGLELESNNLNLSGQTATRISRTSQYPFFSRIYVSAHADLIYRLNNNVSFNAQFGRALFREFAGWEIGVNAKYRFYKSIFLSAGLLQHFNEGSGTKDNIKVASVPLLMIKGGVGVEFSPQFAIGFDYFLPAQKKVLEWEIYTDENGAEITSPKTLESLVRLSFLFGFEL